MIRRLVARFGVDGFPKSVAYPILGVFLAIGAPAGYFALRWALAGFPDVRGLCACEGRERLETYLYLLVATSVVFAILGRRFGGLEDRLKAGSLTDPLTGLANRRHLFERLVHELARSERQGTALALLLIDVDGLKALNDRSGHKAGDAALLAVARAIGETCRRTDLAARQGGDEFAIVAPGTTAEEGLALAGRLRQSLAGAARGPTVSVGIADLARVSAPTPEALIGAADRALYEAKEAGRDRAVVARPQGAKAAG